MQKVPENSSGHIAGKAFNLFLENANRSNRERQGARSPSAKPGTSDGRILVKNSTNADLDAFSVVGIEETLTPYDTNADQFQTLRVFAAITVDITKHWSRFAVVQERILKGNIGAAMVFGETPILVEMDTDSALTDRFAHLKDGSTKFVSRAAGHIPLTSTLKAHQSISAAFIASAFVGLNCAFMKPGKTLASIEPGAEGLIIETLAGGGTTIGSSFLVTSHANETTESGKNVVWGVDGKGRRFFI